MHSSRWRPVTVLTRGAEVPEVGPSGARSSVEGVTRVGGRAQPASLSGRIAVGIAVGLVVALLVSSSACSVVSGTVDLGVPGATGRWIDVVGGAGATPAQLARRALVVAPADVEPRRGALLTTSPGRGSGDPRAAADAMPLVVVVHGLGFDAERMAAATEWPELAASRRVVVAFAEGIEASFNAGPCCGGAVADGIDDVGYIESVIDAVVNLYPVDRSRVFLTGHSNGGMMTYRFACEHPELLAGAASVAGTMLTPCAPAVPVSFLQISGRDDTVVPIRGGESSAQGLGTFPSVADSVAAMAAAAGCGPPEVQQDADPPDAGVEVTAWNDCLDGTRVAFDVVPAEHEYPEFGGYSATERMATFWGL